MEVVVYGKSSGCSFCDKAKSELTEAGVRFKYVDVFASEDFLEFFKTKHETVPQIYVDGNHIGDSTCTGDVIKDYGILVDEDLEW